MKLIISFALTLLIEYLPSRIQYPGHLMMPFRTIQRALIVDWKSY